VEERNPRWSSRTTQERITGLSSLVTDTLTIPAGATYMELSLGRITPTAPTDDVYIQAGGAGTEGAVLSAATPGMTYGFALNPDDLPTIEVRGHTIGTVGEIDIVYFYD